MHWIAELPIIFIQPSQLRPHQPHNELHSEKQLFIACSNPYYEYHSARYDTCMRTSQSPPCSRGSFTAAYHHH